MRVIKVGVVGLGDHGVRHTRLFSEMPDAQVVAVCSRDAARARAVAGQYGAPRWYADYREMMRDPEIEAVDVVTEVGRHGEVVLEALRHDKHVLVEKPLSVSLEETDQVLDLAAECRRVLMVCWVERFDPRRALIRQKIEQGELGELVSVYGRRNAVGRFFDMPRFRRYPIVLEPGLHTVDLMLWFANQPVERVYAATRHMAEPGIAEVYWAMLTFKSGLVGVVEEIWAMPNGAPANVDAYWEVIGTRGTMQLRDPADSFSLWTPEGVKSPDTHIGPEVAGKLSGALRNEFGYFLDRVRDGQPPALGTPAEIRAAIQVGLAIVQSAETGQIVNL
jgi:UDP-N-acetylglucosamine 3-dehydrogenase